MSGTMTTDNNMLTVSELLETGFIKCTICKSVYEDPRLLPCLHTFCHKCIQKIIEIENQTRNLNQSEAANGTDDDNEAKDLKKTENRQKIICPVCKSPMEVSIKDKKSNGFPSNTFMKDLSDMYDYKHEKERHCEYCKFDGKTTPASSLCLDCHDNMCQGCTGAHFRTKVTRCHKVIPYAHVQKGLYDSDIRDFQTPMCVQHTDEPMNIFCEKCELLICKECKVGNHDDHKWSKADKAVLKYEVQMINLLKGIQQQIPSIHKYMQFLTNYEKSIEGGREKLTNNIKKQAEILHDMIEEQKASCLEAVNKACDTERCEVQVRSSNLHTAVTSLENNEEYLRNLLKHGKPEELLTLHREITQRLTQLTHMQMDGINARLKTDFIPGSSTLRNIQTIFGKLSIDHVPLKHSESGLAADSALQISNMLPNVRNTPELIIEFNGEGMSDSKEVWPTGVAVTKDDNLVIVDRDNKKVKIYERNGKLKQEIQGKGENKLETPFDVTVLKSGDIAVSDHEAENVKLFKVTGEHILTITDGIKYPRGITTNSKGEVIILDCQLRQVTIHDPKSGHLLKTIECKDAKDIKVLVDPYYVGVTAQDNIIITDTASPNIKVFSPDGKYLANYGHYGMRNDEVLQPYGVCCDHYGYIFVADNQNHRVHLLLPDGKLSKFLLTKADSLWHPMGLALTENGYLVVTEALGKVKIYKYI
ncbi:E3 ubiquitin-protein ligase TRIM71-like [Ruditapes philippinarum]|uniref:E3 ubiquitin-protein ligase TRIM71-like n=1 Tax=Ruditapes philippinarum TaxID=129788 RepID=UPI00295B7314|nr:E3 ubiquitin-protein ligase TRIM71-like [Ruditapes philippinarum]